jgi:E3 ubiquitin-protein ligase TRIP12
MERLEKRKSLDISFKGEPGTGLGPTYEYFTLLSRSIKDFGDGKMWYTSAIDGTLFPSPCDFKALKPAQLTEITDMFRLAGTFIAKSIVDNKLIDLAICPLMWDLLLGKVSILHYKDQQISIFLINLFFAYCRN